MSSEHGSTQIPCGNCCKIVENDNSTNTIKVIDISDLEQAEIQIIDAISYVYGISWEEFRTWSEQNLRSTNADANDAHWLTAISIKLCDFCSQVLSDNYKAHKTFEQLSHDSSFVQQINKYRRRELVSMPIPNIKAEVDVSFEDPENNDADSYCANNSEDFDVPDAVPEIKCTLKLDKDELLERNLNSTNKKRKKRRKVKPSAESREAVRRSLRTQVSVKLERLSNEDLQDYNRTVLKNPQEKCSTTIKRKGSDSTGKYTEEREQYECKICGKTFTNRQFFLKSHLPKHYGIKFTCELCGAVLSSPKSLQRHKRQLHSGKDKPKLKIPCNICGKLLRADSLRSHIQYQHKENENFKCGTCGKTFLRKRRYSEHILIHSEGFTPYLCGQCGKTFDCKDSLVNHEKLHIIGNFPCDICSKVFPNKNALSTHLNHTHVEERKYVCDECGKSYKFKHHFTMHLKLHKEIAEKGEMSVQCEDCGKYFKHSLSLYKHKVRNHREDLKKIYKCELCGRVLSDATCLRTHKKLVHKIFPKKSFSQPNDSDSPVISQMENPGIPEATQGELIL